MVKEYRLGKLFHLQLSAEPVAVAGSMVLLALVSGVAIGVLQLPVAEAIAGSLLAIGLHWVSTLVHHLGHAWAARRTGYPMTGIRFGTLGVLGTSVYPPDEPALPGKVHIHRALGGPFASLLFTIVALMIALVWRAVDDTLGWVGSFFFLDNLFVFTLGVFLPLGFTDGSTLWKWWGKR